MLNSDVSFLNMPIQQLQKLLHDAGVHHVDAVAICKQQEQYSISSRQQAKQCSAHTPKNLSCTFADFKQDKQKAVDEWIHEEIVCKHIVWLYKWSLSRLFKAATDSKPMSVA